MATPTKTKQSKIPSEAECEAPEEQTQDVPAESE